MPRISHVVLNHAIPLTYPLPDDDTLEAVTEAMLVMAVAVEFQGTRQDGDQMRTEARITETVPMVTDQREEDQTVIERAQRHIRMPALFRELLDARVKSGPVVTQAFVMHHAPTVIIDLDRLEAPESNVPVTVVLRRGERAVYAGLARFNAGAPILGAPFLRRAEL